jgi:hypothetical protein
LDILVQIRLIDHTSAHTSHKYHNNIFFQRRNSISIYRENTANKQFMRIFKIHLEDSQMNCKRQNYISSLLGFFATKKKLVETGREVFFLNGTAHSYHLIFFLL